MVFRSENREQNVKGVLISASSGSGKSYLLRCISSDKNFANTCVFEMDSMRYYDYGELKKRLPKAKEQFDIWFVRQKESIFLEKIYNNIEASAEDERLIKYKFIELCLMPKKFITILPQNLRHTGNGIQFFELLESQFELRFVHIVIIPSFFRYIVNLFYRKKLLNFNYVKRRFMARDLLISKRNCFDDVVEMSLLENNKDHVIKLFRRYIGL